MTLLTENKNSWSRRTVKGNRIYWFLAALCFPLLAAAVGPFFGVGCACAYGSARAAAYFPVISILWARLGIGFVLGEDKRKIVTYLVMPILLGVVLLVIGRVMGIEG